MLGAIIGDIVGSTWEFRPIKSKDFPLLTEANSYTDDSILTCAVADALLNDREPAEALREWARQIRIPQGVGGYGARFVRWVTAPAIQPPYNSYGNGAAMRVSPAAWLSRSLEEAMEMADRVTKVTHDHPEGIKGAQATVHAIWLARMGAGPASIRTVIEETYGYDMQRNIDDVRPVYEYNESCQQTVPEAILCAIEAVDFEDALRNAVSLGGDADTLAAIAGSVAEALFGIPEELRDLILPTLPDRMSEIVRLFRARTQG